MTASASDSSAKRRERKKQVKLQLKLLGEILCDSHKDRQNETEILSKMLAYIIELLPRERINDDRRNSLGKIFGECAFGSSPTIMVDKEFENMLFLNGHFDVKELSKRIVWGDSVSGQMLQEVNGGNDV